MLKFILLGERTRVICFSLCTRRGTSNFHVTVIFHMRSSSNRK